VADSYEGFAAVYEQWAADMTEDVPFYVELAREADGPVVELAVGTARVAIPVARAIRRRVVGLDLSPTMLKQASRAEEEAGVGLDLRLADMRDFSLDEPASTARSARSCTFRRGLTSAARSSASRPRFVPAGASPGTRSASTRRSPCA
jgi:hypothetical protein